MGNCITNIALSRSTFENTKEYTLEGLNKIGKVIKVYDGDTLWVAINIHHNIYKFKVRMLGYDSPEMKPRLNTPNREQEIQAAKKAKEYIEELVLNKNVLVEFSKYDKYGRPLCKLYINKCVFCSKIKLCVNDLMIEKGYGYEYNGGKKKSFK